VLKVGVIGCGTVSGYGHLPTIKSSTTWTLAGISEVNAPRRDEMAAQYKPPVAVADYRELLAECEMDAVVVATHTDGHRDIVIAALERGLHVLCEKPMASNLAQCQEMVAAAQRANRLLAVNFNTRSVAVLREIKRLIDAGTVGNVRVVRFVYDWSAHQWQPQERLETFMRNGGPVIDSGVHFFEGARWFTGQEFTRIEATGVFLPPFEHPQHVVSTCSMSGGAVALIEVGWLYCKRTKDRGALNTYDVIGDDGAISFDAETCNLRIYSKSSTEIRNFPGTGKGFDFVYDQFAQSIKTGKLTTLASGEDGLKATQAAYQALESAHGR
jgi:predicted dehydrogenase